MPDSERTRIGDCPECGEQFTVRSHQGCKQIRCSKCKSAFFVSNSVLDMQDPPGDLAERIRGAVGRGCGQSRESSIVGADVGV